MRRLRPDPVTAGRWGLWAFVVILTISLFQPALADRTDPGSPVLPPPDGAHLPFAACTPGPLGAQALQGPEVPRARRALGQALDCLIATGDPERVLLVRRHLLEGISLVPSLTLDPRGQIFDTTGRPVDLAEAVSHVRRLSPDEAHPGRATFEMGLALLGGQLWYAGSHVINAKDWTYETFIEATKAKFITFEGWRLDENRILLNSPGHVAAGAGYYWLGRANHLDLFWSSVGAFVSSLAWELGPEYREVVSTGDLVVTTVGGVALGESIFQLGLLFNEGQPTAANQVGRVIFAWPSLVHQAIDGTSPHAALDVDPSGLPLDRDHEVYLELLGGWSTTVDAEGGIRFSGTVHRPPSWARPLHQPVRTSLEGELTVSWRGVERGTLLATHVPVAFERSWSLPVPGRVTLGPVFGSRHHSFPSRQPSDVFADVRTGALVELEFGRAPRHIHFGAEVSPAFVLMGSAALPDWEHYHGREALPLVVQLEGYYPGLGYESGAWVWGRLGPATFEARAFLLHGVSIAPRVLPVAPDLVDDALGVTTALTFEIPGTPAELSLSWDGLWRKGTIGVVSDRTQTHRLGVATRLTF